MKDIKLSLLDRQALSDKLILKYKEVKGLKVFFVEVEQSELVDNTLITTVKFYYGLLMNSLIEFSYYNEELYSVTGYNVPSKFIDEMKNLLKEKDNE